MVPGQIIFDPNYLARLQTKKASIRKMCNGLNEILSKWLYAKPEGCRDFTAALYDVLTSDIDGVLDMAEEAAAKARPTGSVN